MDDYLYGFFKAPQATGKGWYLFLFILLFLFQDVCLLTQTQSCSPCSELLSLEKVKIRAVFLQNYPMPSLSTIHRNQRIVFRVYSLEKKAIELAAQKSGLSVSDYARRVCLSQELKTRLTDEEVSIYKMLIEYRNNFARISNLVRHHQDFTQALKSLIDRIDQHLQRFK